MTTEPDIEPTDTPAHEDIDAFLAENPEVMQAAEDLAAASAARRSSADADS